SAMLQTKAGYTDARPLLRTAGPYIGVIPSIGRVALLNQAPVSNGQKADDRHPDKKRYADVGQSLPRRINEGLTRLGRVRHEHRDEHRQYHHWETAQDGARDEPPHVPATPAPGLSNGDRRIAQGPRRKG